MRQPAEPFAKKGFDLLLVETLADALCSWQVLTPRDPIVQCFILNTPAIKLTLEILVAVDAELGRIGKIRAELDEKGPEVFIQTVKIVEVHVGAAVINPGNGAAVAKSLAHRSGTRAFSWATPIKITPS